MKFEFDLARVEANALAKLKSFQRATVMRVDELFRSGQRRVLVADEVGLGKTVVARGVIAKTARLRIEEGDSLFKVAYICANQNIARQNLENLDIDGSVAALSDGMQKGGPTGSAIHKWAGSRLSMLPLFAERQERILAQAGKFIQIIPVTPETSFRMGSRRGLAPERALICAMVGSLPMFSDRGTRTALSNRLRGEVGRSRWLNLVHSFAADIRREEDEKSGFMHRFNGLFVRHGGEAATNALLLSKSDSDIAEGTRILRRIFAEIGAERLEPDLVIMDEFQRFRYLIDDEAGDGGEVRVLFERFLRTGVEKDSPRVLLLSATPFKLYSTREEIADAGKDESYREFEGLVDFLFDKNRADIRESWRRYVERISGVVQDESENPILAKQAAEDALRKGVCRTERTLFQPSFGRRSDSPENRIVPAMAEIRSFVEYSNWARSIGANDRLRVEYAKSVPYLLSFLTGYREQTLLEGVLERNPHALGKASPALRRDMWLTQGAVKRYSLIPPGNARLELLERHAFAEGSGFKPERLLWIPPSFPCYPLTGPFSGSDGYSKILVFSSWKMVPKMVATMLSYEEERRTIATIQRRKGEVLDYFGKVGKRFPAPRLQFRTKGVGTSASTMTLLALLYPSRVLAGFFSTISATNAHLSMKAVLSEIKTAVRRALRGFPDPKEGRSDPRWYYLAPMFFDGDKIALDWCKRIRKGTVFGKANDKSALQRHFKRLESELKAGRKGLGRRPDDLVDVLADMTLGSPAVCLRRSGADADIATQGADAFRSFFNAPEPIAAIDCAYNRSDDAHWKNVLRYGRDGCLQSVLDEYIHLLAPNEAAPSPRTIGKIIAALSFHSVPYKVDTFDALRDRVGMSGASGEKRKMSMRTRFAAAFAEGDGDGEKVANRVESLRGAFNSPFWPFVLASTSIGQEGLDFHWYCRKVFHWNLPHNPIDLEQREGRVDRYHGLAVRENIALQFIDKHNFKSDIWSELFCAAEQCAEQSGDASGLQPHWRNGTDARYGVERIVPLYAFSLDESRYARLVQILSLYRMSLGQPRQEELLDRILRSGVKPEEVRKLFLDLCPFSFRSGKAGADSNPEFAT